MEGRWDQGSGSAHYVEITVTARVTTTFSITIGPDENPFETYTVNANDKRQIRIPTNMVEPIGSEKIENKGIHLVSENPVNVYALNYDANSADVALIYPIQSLGTEHFALCYTPDVNGTIGRNSEFLIVASEDSTIIEITPSVETDKKQPKDSTFSITLNKGQLYQVQSMNQDYLSAQGDLTGSYISSNKPVAFYCGSHGTRIPSGFCCWDHLYEQVPPIHSWGREYFAVPLKSRQQDRYRILASEDNTKIHITGKSTVTINKGQYYEFVLYHNQPSRILADKPILVAQFSQSKDVDASFTGGNGDPFMIILSSTTQVKNDVTFVAYNSSHITRYYVNIISLSSDIENIKFQNQSIAGEFTPFPDSEYSYAQKAISAGTYQLYNTDPDRGFLAYVYGYGGVESYGYGVGFNLNLVLDLGESIDFNGDTLELCSGDTRILDAGPYFDTYLWEPTGDTTQTLNVDTGGKYKVRTTTIDGCVLEDSIFILLSHPEVHLPDDNVGCAPHSIDLDGMDGFEKYVWQNQNNDTLSTNQYYTANQTDEYRITVFDEYNCAARDTMNFEVFPVPKIEISGEQLICGLQTSTLSASISNAPDSVWNFPRSFRWTSDNPALIFSDQSHKTVTITATDWGKYEIYYELTTSDGCFASDTFEVQFHPTPTSEFIFVDDPDDECKGYSREVVYIGNATIGASYFWDYGGAKLIDSIDWNNFTVSIGAYNTNPYLTLHVEENSCWSDTTAKLLGANPDFVLGTEKSRGCDSMTVLFKGELNVEDDLLFEWDFGDGSSISNEQEVEHFYSNTGFYDVNLLITNNLSGCQIGFQIDSMIKVFPTPTASITADETVCFPDSAQLIYTHNIDSSFCLWKFEGAHQSGFGNDSIIMIMDEPFGKAILTVDEYGCISLPIDITLKRLPHFNFYTDFEEGCQPYAPQIIADPIDDLLDFIWLTDSLPHPLGNSAFYSFPDSGRMDIKLRAKSLETACFDTLTKTDWIWVHPKPSAAFEVDFPVALLEHADITFSNYSKWANYYLWDFGDEETSTEFQPIHTYKQLGDYNSRLFVESQYGCKDTAEFSIQILPFTVFTPTAFRPDSEIEENRTFMPLGIGADPSQFKLEIYDRWGQIVFETASPDHSWNGITKNGKPAPMGNYIWISHYYDIQGFEHNQKGQVLLVR